MKIPHDRLSPEALRGVIEEFVLREGTDYGAREASLDAKIEQVRRQLERREVYIVFEAETESMSIRSSRDLPFENEET